MPKSKIFTVFKMLFLGLGIGVVVFWASEFGAQFWNEFLASSKSATPTSSTQLAAVNTEEDVSNSRRNAIVRAVEKAAPSVVSITVIRKRTYASDPYRDPFYEFFFGSAPQEEQEFSSIGSGVIVHEKGYIVTNYHVIQTGEGEEIVEIQVYLSDGRKLEGTFVGEDKANDLAVISIKPEKLPVAKLKTTAENYIGEWTIAIGNPFGYLMGDHKPTVTVGVISALNRTFAVQSGINYHNMIQTDASINPGNSGGALVNSLGEVIGINTFIITGSSQSQGSVGLGFALPIEKAMRVVEEIVKYGYLRSWTTGIYAERHTYVNQLGRRGILISQVDAGSPGDKAGLKAGDLVVAVEGREIASLPEFLEILRKFQVGDNVSIEYYRKDKVRVAQMKLEENKSTSTKQRMFKF